MREVGIDIDTQRPKMLTREMLDGADRVITMGCGVDRGCPANFVPAEDWDIADPEGRSVEEVRVIRDRIEEKVKNLIIDLYCVGGEACKSSFMREGYST